MRDGNRNLLRLSFETTGVIFGEKDGAGPGARVRGSNFSSSPDSAVELAFVDPLSRRPPK